MINPRTNGRRIFHAFRNSPIQTTATATSDATGKIVYPAIEYAYNAQTDDCGTHTYTVREIAYDAKGVKSSTVEHTVTVEVTDKGDGTLDAVASENANALNFTNTYKCL